MDLKVKVDSKKLQKALAKSPRRTKNALQQGINAAGAVFEREMHKEVPKFDGDLKRSIKLTSGNLRVTVEPRIEYAKYIEHGTGPHWVGIKHIKKWALDKGIPPHAVQWSIAQKGTKANPFVERTFDQKENQATRTAVKIIDKRLKRILD